MRTFVVHGLIVGLVSGLSLLATACDKGGGGASDPRARVVDAWKQAGLAPSALTPATVPVGKDCQSGTVGAIDVLLCVYPSPEEAKAAEEPGLAWVGNTTGAAQAHGTVLVGISDRNKSDPSGRTINQLMKLARN
jgi:hypothetical protein